MDTLEPSSKMPFAHVAKNKMQDMKMESDKLKDLLEVRDAEIKKVSAEVDTIQLECTSLKNRCKLLDKQLITQTARLAEKEAQANNMVTLMDASETKSLEITSETSNRKDAKTLEELEDIKKETQNNLNESESKLADVCRKLKVMEELVRKQELRAEKAENIERKLIQEWNYSVNHFNEMDEKLKKKQNSDMGEDDKEKQLKTFQMNLDLAIQRREEAERKSAVHLNDIQKVEGRILQLHEKNRALEQEREDLEKMCL